MAIQQPSALTAKSKKIRILIAGYPGIGKSTLALSAPRPLHIDVDRGIDRVSAVYRKAFIQPTDYDELKNDLIPENLHDFDTLVFDTGGQLIKLMSAWAIKQNIQFGQKDGSLSLKGYGAVGREFERLMNYCYYELNKHIVVLFHAKEEKDGDNTRLRLLVEGQTKDNVWQPMDLGGYLEMNGNKRTLGLSNCERYYAKGTHGINGILPIPELGQGKKNDFLTHLFQQVNKNIAEEAIHAEQEQNEYDSTMALAREIVDEINSPEAATEAIKQISALNHVLTSEREAKTMLNQKAKELGYAYDRQAGGYKCVG
jgi:hypothetical protein